MCYHDRLLAYVIRVNAHYVLARKIILHTFQDSHLYDLALCPLTRKSTGGHSQSKHQSPVMFKGEKRLRVSVGNWFGIHCDHDL